MENLSTDNIMRLQVEQLEKEKKELNERMRVATKRLDHTERAYRKEERPLLSQDYEVQQANDRAAHEAAQKARIENYRLSHEQDIETKKRLLRMMDDYKTRRDAIIGKRGEEFAKRKAAAEKKINDEKAKRRELIFKQREEDRLHREEEERIRREKEEEQRRIEEGLYHPFDAGNLRLTLYTERRAEEERKEAEEAAARAEEERKKEEAEAKAAEARKQRDAERQAAMEQARVRAQREAEAEARAEARRTEQREREQREREQGPGVWRRSERPNPPVAAPGTPNRVPTSLPPARSESPAPAPKFRPGGNAASSGWRAREAAKATGTPADIPSRTASPAPPAPRDEPPAVDEEGFQRVPARGVWRRGRGRA